MLRMIFCFGLIAIGVLGSFFGPFYALLFYLWNAYFRPEDWTYGPLIGSLQLSWLIGLYLVAATAMSAPKYPLNWRIGLMGAFVVDTVVGVVTSEHPELSWTAWVMFAKVALVAYFIPVLVTNRVRYRQALLVIALSLGFEGAKQGWAQLFLNPGGVNSNTVSFLGDNNGVALGMMMLVPLFGALAQTAESRLEAWVHRFFLVGVLMRGLTTYSRGGFIAALILGMAGLFRSRKRLRYIIGAGVLVTLVTTVMPQAFWDRVSTITVDQDEERDESAQGRLHFWAVAVEMAKQKPLTGVGFNVFSASYEKYNTDDRFSGDRAVHSVWFGVLSELGVPGLAAFVALWLAALWTCWRISVWSGRNPGLSDVRTYANALLSSLLVFGTAGTFLSVQYGEMFWHFVGLVVALVPLANPGLVTEEPQSTPAPVRRHPALAGL